MTDHTLHDLAEANTKAAHFIRAAGPNIFGQTVEAYTTMIDQLLAGAKLFHEIERRRAQRVSREAGADL